MKKISRGMIYIVIIMLFSKSVYSAVYYVSPNGDDTKDGLSINNAWKTISKVNSINFNAGDQILFEGGETFSGGLSFDNNDTGTDADPIIVGSYGTGRAIINSGSLTGFEAYNSAGIKIQNLNFVGDGYNTKSSTGIYFHIDLPNVTLKHIYIDSCDVSDYGKGGIRVSGDSNTSGYDDIRITNSTAHGNINGISVSGVVPSLHSNLYIADCIAYDNPGYENNTGFGILISGASGVIEYCEAYNNGYGNIGDASTGGPIGIMVYRADSVIIQYCISHNNKTGPNNWDGGGFDIDGGSTNCILQYNYAYENYGQGLMMGNYSGALPKSNNTVRYNISENNGLRHNYGGINFWGPSGGNVTDENAEVYNNIVYVSNTNVISGNPSCVRHENGIMDNIALYNNIFIAADGLNLVDVQSQTSEFTFCNNLYWSIDTNNFNIRWGNSTYNSLSDWKTGTGQEQLSGRDAGIQADPLLTNPGYGEKTVTPRSLANLNAYKQQDGSPCKDTGIDLETAFGIIQGLNDFYGNTIPQNALYDIGAHESDAVTFTEEVQDPLPSSFKIYSNFPNPFNQTTTIKFEIPSVSWANSDHVVPIAIDVFDLQGKLIKNLTNKNYSPGSYSVVWDGKGKNNEMLPSGLYIYQLRAANYKTNKMMMMVR